MITRTLFFLGLLFVLYTSTNHPTSTAKSQANSTAIAAVPGDPEPICGGKDPCLLITGN